jgi:hypothetical protein
MCDELEEIKTEQATDLGKVSWSKIYRIAKNLIISH